MLHSKRFKVINNGRQNYPPLNPPIVTISSNAGNFSSAGSGGQVPGRGLSISLLKALAKIGRTAKARFIGYLGDIAGVLIQQAQGLVKPVFFDKGNGRFTREQDHFPIQFRLAVAHLFVEIIHFQFDIAPGLFRVIHQPGYELFVGRRKTAYPLLPG